MVEFQIGQTRVVTNATCGGFRAWYLTPSVRLGFRRDGFFLGVTFLQFDACVWTERKPA